MAASGGDWWCLPGGTVDAGEALEASLEREMYEETAITPKVGKLLYVHQFMFKDKEQLEFFFHVTNPTDYLNVDLNKTSHGAEEIEKTEFVDPKETVILPKFLTEESLQDQIKPEVPVKFFSFESES